MVTPSTKITDKEELPKAQGLLILLVSYIIICFSGLFGSPGSISKALLYGLPFLCISYILAKTRLYKTGGVLAIFTTFFIVAVIVIRIDLESKFSYLSLSWITITVFMATIFLKFRYVLVITAIQLLFSIGLSMLTSNISTPVFISWSVLNGFFIIINLSTRWIIEKQHRLLIEQNSILEKMVHRSESQFHRA